MVSPQVATEVGSRLGMVEEVERRRRQDDLNFFMRVRVALPITKPLRMLLNGLDKLYIMNGIYHHRMCCHHRTIAIPDHNSYADLVHLFKYSPLHTALAVEVPILGTPLDLQLVYPPLTTAIQI